MESPTPQIVHVIQLAVAPVFLVSGVAGLLAVMTNRLGRIIDRARTLEDRIGSMPKEALPTVRIELADLSRRMGIINIAITLNVICALMICAVIAALFIGTYWKVDFSLSVSILFTVGIIALIGGLMLFLREIFIATRSVRLLKA